MIREFNGPLGFEGLHRIENSRKNVVLLPAKKCPKEDNVKYVHAKVVSTVGSRYPEFWITRPRLLRFVIRKTKPNPVFFRILRPK